MGSSKETDGMLAHILQEAGRKEVGAYARAFAYTNSGP